MAKSVKNEIEPQITVETKKDDRGLQVLQEQGISVNDLLDEFDLTHFEKLFIVEYVNCGGIGTKAARTVRPHLTDQSAGVAAFNVLKKNNVKAALERYIDVVVLNKATITTNFLTLARGAESEAARVQATDKLARIAGLYGANNDGNGNGSGSVNVQINLPAQNTMRVKKDTTIIDVDPE